MIHAVKCLPEYFAPLNSGAKTFEVRKNDRPYRVGDYLAVNEFVPFNYKFKSDDQYQQYAIKDHKDGAGMYSDRFLIFKIIYVLDDTEYCKEDMVILGLKKCWLEV